MTERILDFSQDPAYLHRQGERLVISVPDQEDRSMPFFEIAALVLSHPQITCSLNVLSACATHQVIVVVADETQKPSGMLLPLDAHFIQAERFEKQAAASLPLRKRLWKQIVRAKILAQARCLRQVTDTDQGLEELANGVRSGDPENLEAQAAQRYWPAIFGDPHFRRDFEAGDQNRFLNYGYAVLRAIVARALCSSGLHPSLGLHHRNRYNAFRLADDLMEPFRPMVDRVTVSLVNEYGTQAPMGQEIKSRLIQPFLARYRMNKEERTFFDWVGRTCQSLVASFTDETPSLWLAEFE